MPRTRPPYPLEFREEAVRLARESGKPSAQIAQDLGISYESLRHWVKQVDLDSSVCKRLTTVRSQGPRQSVRPRKFVRHHGPALIPARTTRRRSMAKTNRRGPWAVRCADLYARWSVMARSIAAGRAGLPRRSPAAA